MAGTYIDIGGGGGGGGDSLYWGEAVATFAGLPLGAVEGEIRLVTDTYSLYAWDAVGTQWVQLLDGLADVSGPASSTDSAIVRFDGTTGKVIKNSGATATDAEINHLSGVTSSIQTQINARLPLAGGTMSGAIVQPNLPVGSNDLTNKTYVDGLLQSVKTKDSVRCATNGNITLSGEQTIDGVLTSGSRVLVRAQSAPAENGIYLSAAGAWSRTTDADTWDKLVSAFVFVEQGSTYADTGWKCISDAGGTLGVTAVTWTQIAGAGTYVAGSGLTLTGTTFSITAPVSIGLGGTNSTAALANNRLMRSSAGAVVEASNIEVSSAGGIDMTTTTAAMRVPRLSTTQRDALSAANGMLIYNTTTNRFQGYVDGAWQPLHGWGS